MQAGAVGLLCGFDDQFPLDTRGEKVTGEIRQEITDEIMCQIAALMPEEYHGEYAGCKSEPKYLKFS